MKFCGVITTVVSDSRVDTVLLVLLIPTHYNLQQRGQYTLKVLPLSLRSLQPFLPPIYKSIFCREISIFYVYLEFSNKPVLRRICDSLCLTEGTAELDAHKAEPSVTGETMSHEDVQLEP